MPDVFKTSPSRAVPPFVLALDVGSTASRGSLYDARGLPIAGSKLRLAHSFTTATDGTSTVDADAIAVELAQIIDFVTKAAQGRAIAGVAIDTPPRTSWVWTPPGRPSPRATRMRTAVVHPR